MLVHFLLSDEQHASLFKYCQNNHNDSSKEVLINFHAKLKYKQAGQRLHVKAKITPQVSILLIDFRQN